MATAHLICGLPAAGKTTYSSSLKVKTAGVQFSLDRWLVTAYGQYSIDTIGNNKHTHRVIVCRTLIWTVCEEFLQRNVDVIIDDGFFLREHRTQYAKMCRTIDVDVTVHYINTPIEIIEKRIKRRNNNLPTNNFAISPSLFGLIIGMFNEPSADEGIKIHEIKYNLDNKTN